MALVCSVDLDAYATDGSLILYGFRRHHQKELPPPIRFISAST